MPLKLTPKFWLLVLLLVAATIALTWKAKALEKRLFSDSSSSSALVGKPAPDLQLVSLSGQPVSLQTFRGKKKVVVSFWASWCGPCRLELPVLQAFYDKHHAASDTFEILAVSTDEDRSDAEKYMKEAGLHFPILWDPNGEAQKAFSVDAIPALFVIDENGKVLSGDVGYDSSMEANLLQRLNLKPDSKAPENNDHTSD
jgi:peroxiredoxin